MVKRLEKTQKGSSMSQKKSNLNPHTTAEICTHQQDVHFDPS